MLTASTQPTSTQHVSTNVAMERICQATGAKTQFALAELLGISQPSISDAKRRGVIPEKWLFKLFRQYNINPDWILYGHEPQYLNTWPAFDKPSNPAQGTALEKMLQDILDAVALARAHQEHLGRSLEQARRAVVSEHKEWEDQALLIESPDGSINPTSLQKADKKGMDCIVAHIRFLTRDFVGRP